MNSYRRLLPLASLAVLLSLAGGGMLYAQLEGADRGIPPIDSSNTLEVTGIDVDVTGKTSEDARLQGWREAQRRGWRALWAKTTGRPANQAPSMPDSALNAIVSGVIIENEQIGPSRYIARLGILFDRGRAGQLLGIGPNQGRRSAPMLVVPVLLTGSTFHSFEWRNPWQRAWAQFRTGNSAIDYVRPTGSGIDPLLLNQMQTKRPGRDWWRMLLDQYGAADVVVPQVHLKRTYPGGPAIGVFSARFGPDNRLLGRFTLRVENSGAIPRMLDEGIRRLDRLYTQALNAGRLQPDRSLIVQEPDILAEIAARIEAANAAMSTAPPPPPPPGPVPVGPAAAYNIQVETPTAADVTAAEIAVSRVRGVTSAITSSLALGGTSILRVTFVGDPNALAAGLRAQGWEVENVGGVIRISRPRGGPEED